MNVIEFYHTQILSVVLGGGVSSRLFQIIREQLGIAYSVGSFNSSYFDSGLFTIYASSDQNNINKLLSSVFTEIKKIQDGISKKELERAKSQIRTAILISEEHSEYKSEEIGKNFSLFQKYFPPHNIIDAIMGIKIEDIMLSAEKTFLSRPTLSTVGSIPSNFHFDKF